MVGRYRSMIGSNFHFCLSRFKFNQAAFYDGCGNINCIIKRHCAISMDNMRYGVAQFLYDSIILRDTPSRYGRSFLLTSDEINCIVNYLATV